MTTVGKTEHERTTTGTVRSAHQDATTAGENTRAPPEGTTARYTDDQKTSNSVHPSSPAATTSTEAKQMTDMNGMISTVEEQEWPRAKTDHSDDAFESTHKQNESERSTTTQAERTTANGERSTTPSTSLKTTERDKLASVTTREKIHVNDTGTFSTTQKKQYGLSTNTVRVRLGFDADYGDRVQGRQWQFAAHMRQQLSGLLRVPLDGIQNVTVTPGSIRLAFDLVPVKTATLELGRPDLEAARADLMTRINRGTVTLTDLDGNRLPIFTTYSSRGDTILMVASIISATFIASVLLLLVILFVQKRMNRTSKVTPTHQLYNRHLEQSDSFSGLVPGRGLLSRHLNQSVGKEILSHFTSRQDSAVPGPPEYKLPGKSAASDDETSQDEYTQSDSSVYPDTSDCTPSTFTHWTTANSAHLEDTHLRLDRP
ncbi:uncharacterized protein LOC135392187 [Ornithodoros turicata]|uniref:uncharacterized protein LOC135392187 n=1 Tax=Ornithodoros turicata TaxID=34597 RepID=UPI0031392192